MSSRVPMIVLAVGCFAAALFFFKKGVEEDAESAFVKQSVVEIKQKREHEFRNCIFVAGGTNRDGQLPAATITACLQSAETLHPLPEDKP